MNFPPIGSEVYFTRRNLCPTGAEVIIGNCSPVETNYGAGNPAPLGSNFQLPENLPQWGRIITCCEL